MYNKILNKLITLDNEKTILNEEKASFLSIIDYAINHNQYSVRNEILNFIHLIKNYKFENEKKEIKGL